MTIEATQPVDVDSGVAVKHWIGGEFVAGGGTGTSINPATGEKIGTYADADAATGQAAIDAAARAFAETSWKSDAMLRAIALGHLADAYDARLGEIVETLTRENGKLAREAGFEAHFIPRALRFAAGLAVQPHGRATDPLPGVQALSIRQAIGVAGLIAPWNSPAYLSIRALAPALAAGCAVVLKLPAQAAQSAALLSDIFASVPEFPAGIVNVVVESGSEVAQLLVSSPQVPVVSYTGSTATGRIIARNAAENFKRVGLELGGKTPHLVFADADIDVAVGTAVASSTVFAGQFCMTGSRILVQRDIADQFIEKLAGALSSVKAGPASDPTSQDRPDDRHRLRGARRPPGRRGHRGRRGGHRTRRSE